ncbi:hypothetical protein AAG570_009794 [Ranatra chinensis]|uniref:PDZ domain-containing protein n=1 Tax=Ranatra chinensis TaxID=642074 RepID=A0ABD0YQD6_9HEMI
MKRTRSRRRRKLVFINFTVVFIALKINFISSNCVAKSQKFGSDNWVAVHSLQTQRDGGILDPDDRLQDVADDREQIIANFGEGEGVQHTGGDGASGSSVGTNSPDIFQGENKYHTDIEVTNEQIASGVPGPLQVRRGSEPALNQILPANGPSNGHAGGLPVVVNDTSKRWSAAPLITEPRDRPPGRKDDRGHSNGYSGDKWGTHMEEEEMTPLRPPPAFARDGSNRLSMQFFGDLGYRWCDAAEKAMLHNRMQSLSLPREHKRKEPLGQANTGSNSPQPTENAESTDYIVLETGNGGLGLHVVPDYDTLGRERGLLVQGVEPGGRVDADGRLQVNDRIVDINGNNLIDQPVHVVQEIFKDSLRCPELRLKVVKAKSAKKPPPPVFPKPATYERAEPITMIDEGERCVVGGGSKVNCIGPLKKLPAPSYSLQTANTRRMGRKVEIALAKGQYGLGFSVTTRDNPAGGNCPIYIKNILPKAMRNVAIENGRPANLGMSNKLSTKGAAVEDGRLRPGDRLLAVDGVEVTGKSQADVVAMLRNVPPGATVRILVSRQQETNSPNSSDVSLTPEINNCSPSPNQNKPAEKETNVVAQANNATPSSSGGDSADDNNVYPWKQREIITLDIPVHDSEKAGLGVSVKGKTSSSNNSGNNSNSSSVDLGIFVKSVIHGGAASRDGRLKTNDQLLNVNGISLLGQSNSGAMETLRRALLRTDGPVPGHITLTIARRLNSRSSSVSSLLTDSSANTETFGARIEENSATGENSGASENSDNTVIFMPPYKNHIETIAMRNPVIDRLTGQSNNLNSHLSNPLRNESYYRATHQTTLLLNGDGKFSSPTVNLPPSDTVIIEDDGPYVPSAGNRRVETDKVNGQQRNSTSSSQTADITYASQLSLDDAAGFSRDAFGRQSMSEKRHAALDAKNTDTYQRNKKAREEREKLKREGRLMRVNSAESIAKLENNNAEPTKNQLGPSLGMKKSSSLESLQTMVQEMAMAEDSSGTYRNSQGAVRVVRGRGCNESFRAAVDRTSFDTPLGPLREDETDIVPGQQPSLNTSMESKSSKEKKKPSLLKGIGSMFRFGKHRKDGVVPVSTSETDEKEAARRAAREEQERIQEQYRRLLLRQQEFSKSQEQQQQQPGGDVYSNIGGEQSRTDRINQLRAEHQRRHMARRGHYPLDDKEERYEQQIKQSLEGSEFESSAAINRPGSRVGISDPARYSHYVNYHEIQQHLKEEIAAVKLRRPKQQESSDDESRRQQHYHSQRQAPRDVHRPASNFYEYESVQAVLRAAHLDPNSNSLPRRSEIITSSHGVSNLLNGNILYSSSQQQQQRYSQHPLYSTVHKNGPPQPSSSSSSSYHQKQHTSSTAYRQHIFQANSRNSGKSSNSGGPFVTHVTIRETQHHSPSPKV